MQFNKRQLLVLQHVLETKVAICYLDLLMLHIVSVQRVLPRYIFFIRVVHLLPWYVTIIVKIHTFQNTLSLQREHSTGSFNGNNTTMCTSCGSKHKSLLLYSGSSTLNYYIMPLWNTRNDIPWSSPVFPLRQFCAQMAQNY